MGESNRIKPWNTKATSIPDDESMFIDYEDEAKSIPCSAKLKTKDINLWLSRHKAFYQKDTTWEEKQTFTQMKFKPEKSTQLVVKFYPSTGVVFAQSKDVMKWASHDVDEMKMTDKDKTFVKEIETRGNQAATENDLSKQSDKEKKSRIPGPLPMNDSKTEATIPKKKNTIGDDKGQMLTPNSEQMSCFNEALHRLESVFVETVQNAYDEKDKVQNTAYLNEIDNLKNEKEMMNKGPGKEINYLKKQHELEEEKMKEELGRMKKECESLKHTQQNLQGQYDRNKKEYESLLLAHTKLKTSLQTETEQLTK